MTAPLRKTAEVPKIVARPAAYEYPALVLISALEYDKLYLPNTLKRLLIPHCQEPEAFFELCLKNGLIEENRGQYGLAYKIWQTYQPDPGTNFTQTPNLGDCGIDFFGNKGTYDLKGNVVHLETQSKIAHFHNTFSSDQVGASAILASIVDGRIKTIPYQTGNILDRKVSIFRAPVTNKFGTLITIREVLLNEIRTSKHLSVTRILRSKPTTTIQEIVIARQYKQLAFDYVTWSCVCSYHHDGHIQSYSQVVCLDADHLGEHLQRIFQLVKNDPSTVAVFISPSGDGLKILYETDSSKTQVQWYRAYASRLLKLTGLPETYVDPIDGKEKKHIDPTCSNVSRACFLPSHDSVYINPALL